MSGRLMREAPPPDHELEALLARAREHVMSPAEILAQKRSFVVGQLGMAHPDLPIAEIRARVDRALGLVPDDPAPVADPVEAPSHYDAEYGVEVSIAEDSPERPVAITLPSDIRMDTGAARAFAAAILAVADYADAHPEPASPAAPGA